jgi:carboxymethylenebutenolidase
MKKSSKDDQIPEQAYELYDQYAHGFISRRKFMQRLGHITVGGIATAALLQNLFPNYTLAEQVSFNHPDIKASYQNFPSPQGHGTGQGYLVKPSNLKKALPVAGYS